MKIVRFASVVSRAGKPEHYLTWNVPAHDPVLRKALKETKLMTVQQQVRGAKKDFGTVGLAPGRNVQYLIFPRSLRAFTGDRVVAINYESIGERVSPVLPKSKRDSRAAGRRKTVGTAVRPKPEPASPVPDSGPPVPARPSPPSGQEIEMAISSALRDLKRRRPAAATKRRTELLAAVRSGPMV